MCEGSCSAFTPKNRTYGTRPSRGYPVTASFLGDAPRSPSGQPQASLCLGLVLGAIVGVAPDDAIRHLGATQTGVATVVGPGNVEIISPEGLWLIINCELHADRSEIGETGEDGWLEFAVDLFWARRDFRGQGHNNVVVLCDGVVADAVKSKDAW